MIQTYFFISLKLSIKIKFKKNEKFWTRPGVLEWVRVRLLHSEHDWTAWPMTVPKETTSKWALWVNTIYHSVQGRVFHCEHYGSAWSTTVPKRDYLTLTEHDETARPKTLRKGDYFRLSMMGHHDLRQCQREATSHWAWWDTTTYDSTKERLLYTQREWWDSTSYDIESNGA